MDPQQAALEGWLRFNDEDVAYNRDGSLSPRQRRHLAWSATWRLALGGAVTITAAVIAAVVVDTALAVLIAIVAVLFGLYFTWIGFASMVDATSGEVAFVTAPLKTRIFRGRYTSYFVDVGPISKSVRKRAFDAIRSGDTYHLYYSPGSRTLLSLEPASAAAPLPVHRFGPDSAHAWDRLRWSWILLTVGLFAALVGTHQVVAAHPAHAVRVAGTIQDYVETTTTGRGASTERSIYITGDDNVYTPEAPDQYTPPPDFYALIGKSVVLYVNQGTTDVIALNDGETTYAGDWYLHPEHETDFLRLNGALTAVEATAFVALGLLLLYRDRRRAAAIPGRSIAYAPPSPRGVTSMWATIGVFTAIGAFVGLAIAASK